MVQFLPILYLLAVMMAEGVLCGGGGGIVSSLLSDCYMQYFTRSCPACHLKLIIPMSTETNAPVISIYIYICILHLESNLSRSLNGWDTLASQGGGPLTPTSRWQQVVFLQACSAERHQPKVFNFEMCSFFSSFFVDMFYPRWVCGCWIPATLGFFFNDNEKNVCHWPVSVCNGVLSIWFLKLLLHLIFTSSLPPTPPHCSSFVSQTFDVKCCQRFSFSF